MIELIHTDCMEYMASLPDEAFDLAIVDPPYYKGPNRRGFYGGGVCSKTGVKRIAYPKTKGWAKPTRAYFDELRRVSTHQIIWGANHFISSMPLNSTAWIIWDKCNPKSDFADAELAWTSFSKSVRLFPFMWNGMCQGTPGNGRKMQGNKKLNEKRVHPTQKPVELYRWLLQNYAEPGQRILDTHLGSGSSAIAAEMEGFDFVGTEIERVYFDASCERLEAYRRSKAA